MSRPPEIYSKTISVRVPMEDYLRFLTEATRSKLSLSEYLFLRIYQEDKAKEFEKKLSDKEAKIKVLESDLKKMASNSNLTAQDQKTTLAEVKTLKNKITVLEAEKTTLIANQKSTTMEATTETRKLQSENTTLQNTIKIKTIELEKIKAELSASVKHSEKVLAEHQKFVADNIGYIEEIAKKKGGRFYDEQIVIMDKLKTGK
jgi:hypothetical protein